MYQGRSNKTSRSNCQISSSWYSDDGLPHVLPCVREAEALIMKQDLNHEYLGIVSAHFRYSFMEMDCFAWCFGTVLSQFYFTRLEMWNMSIML